MADLVDELSVALAELDEDAVLQHVRDRLAAGVAALEIVGRLQEGMTEVGARFQSGEYFLNELVMCGEIMKEAMVELEPHLQGAAVESRGNVVIGTVKGDVHDLGKNIVVMLLKGAGYNTVDLGVDVPPEKFVEAIRQYAAPVVGMSALLTATQRSMKDAVDKIRSEGLDVKVIIGGSYMNETIRNFVGADYFTTSASEGVQIINGIFRLSA